jgi:hypothetical protein
MAQDGVRLPDGVKPATHRVPYEAGNYMSESVSRLRVPRQKSVVICAARPGTKNDYLGEGQQHFTRNRLVEQTLAIQRN